MKIILTSDTHRGHGGSHRPNSVMWRRIAKQQPDVLIHAGDWSSTRLCELESELKSMRNAYSGIVVGTRGNHDRWNTDTKRFKPKSLRDVDKLIEELFKEHSVLNSYIDEANKILITSFPGWYEHCPPSSDSYYIPGISKKHELEILQSSREFLHTLVFMNEDRFKGWTKIVVTHFNITPCDYHNMRDSYVSRSMSGNYEYFNKLKNAGMTHLCFGHTHVKEDYYLEDVRILNAGSDYCRPSYLVFEV